MRSIIRAAIAVSCVAALTGCDRPATKTTATTAATCDALSAEMVNLRKTLSGQEFGMFANSAPQGTQKATEIANTLSLMRLNLDLMSAHQCAMPSEPFRENSYQLAVLQCLTSKDEDRKAKCDEKNWQTTDETIAAEKAAKASVAAKGEPK